MNFYGFGQARDARIFMRNNWAVPMRPMIAPPPILGGGTTFVNFRYNYQGPSPLLWLGLGALKGYADYSQQKQYMKMQEQQMQQQTLAAQADQEAQTLQSLRPAWKITPYNGQYIATKLDKEGNVIEEVTGDFATVREKTKGEVKA